MVDYNKIRYVNIHAHTEYSLLDGVGSPKELYMETLRKGHAAVCVTDHASYASSGDLVKIDQSFKSDKKITKLLEEKNKESHPTLKGCEIYIYDDRYHSQLHGLYKDLVKNRAQILKLIQKLQLNDKYKSLFGKYSDKFKEDVFEKKKRKTLVELGPKLLTLLEHGNDEQLLDSLDEFKLFADKTIASSSYKYGHMVVIAKNAIGHKNLSYLSSMAHLPENFYKRPRVPLSELIKRKEGLIVATACFVGLIPQEIYRETGDAKELMELFVREFKDDFYVEVTISNIDNEWDSELQKHVDIGENLQHKVTLPLVEMAMEMGLENQIVITQDSHMPKKEDKYIQDVMILSDASNRNGWHFKYPYYVLSIEEMHEKFKETFPMFSDEQFEKWCNNTGIIIDKCKEFKIDRSLKMLQARYDAHPLVNPIRVKEEKIRELLSKNNLSSKEDYYIVKIQAQEVLNNVKLVESLIDYSCLDSSFIDERATEESREYNQELKDKMYKWLDEYSYLPDVQFVIDFLKEDGFKSQRESLELCLLVAFHNKKFPIDKEEYVKRFFFEIKVIQFNGVAYFAPYFLTFVEIIDYLYAVEEVKGPGRGSAAGCLFSYALDITDIDPIRRNLPFWRFMLEERIGVVTNTFSDMPVNFDAKQSGDYLKSYNEMMKILNGKDLSDAQNELFYMRCKPHIATYFMKLRSEKYFNEKNENNSLVAYLLGLTTKPTGELNQSEPSPPDIDFDSSSRDGIIRYLVKTKGRDRVVLIGTYGSLKVKSAMKQVFRVEKELSPTEQDKITALIDRTKFSEEDESKGMLHCFHMAIDSTTELKSFFHTRHLTKQKIEQVLGSYNQIGIHACGVILLDNPVWELIPLWYSKDKQMYISQYDKDISEFFGAVKMDYLGLSNIEVLRNAYKLIKKRHGIDYLVPGAFEKIIDNMDPKDVEAVTKGDTLGIFQMNTPTQTDGYKKLNKIPDIEVASAMNALKRPGPMLMGTDSQFERRFNGEEEVSFFIHEKVQAILEDTKGCLIYQEQVMEICQQIGGFTPFEADKIRKAMGKKKFDIISKYEAQFVKHAIEVIGLSKKDAQHLWNMCAKFAEYAFNRSHSFAYAFVSFLCLHARANYPLEYICSLYEVATSKNGDKEKRQIKEFNQRWADLVMPPCVKNSKHQYIIEDDKIYMPLSAIKSIGAKVSDAIITHRPYESFSDFCIKSKAFGFCGKADVENLIYAGACDSFTNLNKEKKELIEHNKVDELEGLIKEYAYLGKIDQEKIDDLSDCPLGIPKDSKTTSASLDLNNFTFSDLRERRTSLLKAYYKHFYHLKIKDTFRKKVKAIHGDDDRQLYYEILKTEGIQNTKVDNESYWSLDPKLLKEYNDGKFHDYSKVAKSHHTAKESEALEKILYDFDKFTNRQFILKEAELLSKAGDDFNVHFNSIAKNIVSNYSGDILLSDPENANRVGSEIVSILSEFEGHIYNNLKHKDPYDIVCLINTYYRYHQSIFWKKVDSLYHTILEKIYVTSDEKYFQTIRSYLYILSLDKDRRLSKFHYETMINRDSLISKDLYKLLKICGHKPTEGENSETINNKAIIKVSTTTLAKLSVVKTFLDKGREFYSLVGKLDVSSYIPTLLTKILKECPRIKDEKARAELSEELRELGVSDIFLYDKSFNLEKRDTRLEFNREHISYLKGDVFIQGMIFRAESKYFLKEYGAGTNRRQLMNFYLRNKEFACAYTFFDTRDNKVFFKSKEYKLSEKIKDYSPALVKSKLAINFSRNLEVQFYPSGKNVESVYFLMDYLE